MRPGRLAVLLVLLVGTYVASLVGPPPPSMAVVGASDVAFMLAIGALAAWADRAPTPAELAAAPRGAR